MKFSEYKNPLVFKKVNIDDINVESSQDSPNHTSLTDESGHLSLNDTIFTNPDLSNSYLCNENDSCIIDKTCENDSEIKACRCLKTGNSPHLIDNSGTSSKSCDFNATFNNNNIDYAWPASFFTINTYQAMLIILGTLLSVVVVLALLAFLRQVRQRRRIRKRCLAQQLGGDIINATSCSSRLAKNSMMINVEYSPLAIRGMLDRDNNAHLHTAVVVYEEPVTLSSLNETQQVHQLLPPITVSSQPIQLQPLQIQQHQPQLLQNHQQQQQQPQQQHLQQTNQHHQQLQQSQQQPQQQQQTQHYHQQQQQQIQQDLYARFRHLYLKKEHIELMMQIGEGAFGTVHKALLWDDKVCAKRLVAVKTVKDPAGDLLKEIELMTSFNHPNILQVIGLVAQDEVNNSPGLVMEFMQHGDLASVLRSNKPGHSIPLLKINHEHLFYLATQIARGMHYLASMRYVHRDLACRNCLIGSRMLVKVSDFGMSRDIYSTEYYMVSGGNRILPVRWMAPECLDYGHYSELSDVWSFGIVMWEIYTYGSIPYNIFSNKEVSEKIIRNELHLEKPELCPASVWEQVIVPCWRLYDERPRFSELIVYVENILRSEKEACTSQASEENEYCERIDMQQ